MHSHLRPGYLELRISEISAGGIEYEQLSTGINHPHLFHLHLVSPYPETQFTHATHQSVHHLLARPETLCRGHLQEQVIRVRINLHR